MTDKIDDAIFDFAYELAMRDATMRTAFMGASIYTLLAKRNPETKEDPTDAERESARKAKRAVRCYVGAIFKGFKGQKEHDDCFNESAETVIAAFKNYCNKDSKFTFGNAQKLINMTVKYLFITTYDNADSRGKYKYCHCPMDSILVARAIEALKKYIQECEDDEQRKVADGMIRGKITRLKESWSSIEKDKRSQYDQFQSIVKFLVEKSPNCNSRIEYDYLVWNEQDEEKK